LGTKAICPYCKARLTTNDLLILSDTKPENAAEEIKTYTQIGGIMDFSTSHSKLQNLEVLLEAKRGGKILIFSCSDTSFAKLTPILERKRIKYEYLKGNGSHVNNVMEKYKTGDINVLLVNVRYYGSGFNMENTTDVIMFHKFDTEIEKQVVGRAQRFGRTSELNVWYLMYENE
jgi:SNF2 family DNA or RNA helicase